MRREQCVLTGRWREPVMVHREKKGEMQRVSFCTHWSGDSIRIAPFMQVNQSLLTGGTKVEMENMRIR